MSCLPYLLSMRCECQRVIRVDYISHCLCTIPVIVLFTSRRIDLQGAKWALGGMPFVSSSTHNYTSQRDHSNKVE